MTCSHGERRQRRERRGKESGTEGGDRPSFTQASEAISKSTSTCISQNFLACRHRGRRKKRAREVLERGERAAALGGYRYPDYPILARPGTRHIHTGTNRRRVSLPSLVPASRMALGRGGVGTNSSNKTKQHGNFPTVVILPGLTKPEPSQKPEHLTVSPVTSSSTSPQL